MAVDRILGWLDPKVRERSRFNHENPDAPWWSMNSITPIEKLLKPEFIGFEFGAGRSSIWLARRVAKLVSLETAPEWHEKILAQAAKLGITHKLDIILQLMGTHMTTTPEQRHAYLTQIDQFPHHHFDFILVDAWFRPETFERAFAFVKPGGYVILDNADREDMIAPTNAKKDQLLAWYDDGGWATAVYQVA